MIVIKAKKTRCLMEYMKCEHCGKTVVRLGAGQKFCSRKCQSAAAYRREHKQVVINCACCGKEMLRIGANHRVCRHKCTPVHGMKQTCARCGEEKPYAEFYDYRGSVGFGAKLMTTCKECIRTDNRERWRNSHA